MRAAPEIQQGDKEAKVLFVPFSGLRPSADGGLVLLHDIGRHATASRHGNTLLLGPFPYCLGIDPGGRCGGASCLRCCCRFTRADLTRGRGEFAESLAQRRRVLLAEVDLVDAAVKSE